MSRYYHYSPKKQKLTPCKGPDVCAFGAGTIHLEPVATAKDVDFVRTFDWLLENIGKYGVMPATLKSKRGDGVVTGSDLVAYLDSVTTEERRKLVAGYLHSKYTPNFHLAYSESQKRLILAPCEYGASSYCSRSPDFNSSTGKGYHIKNETTGVDTHGRPFEDVDVVEYLSSLNNSSRTLALTDAITTWNSFNRVEDKAKMRLTYRQISGRELAPSKVYTTYVSNDTGSTTVTTRYSDDSETTEVIVN